MSDLIIGLTGGIGSGKTTVSDIFTRQHNIVVVDADVISREVVAPSSNALRKIKHYFGSSVVDATNHLNRLKLRNIVFDSDKKSLVECLAAPTSFGQQCSINKCRQLATKQ